MLEVDREQALAFRVAGHHLAERTDPASALRACGVQEAPPGWGVVALHARSDGGLPHDAVLVNAMRGAPHYVLAEDLPVFTRGLVPDETGLKALVGSLVAKELAGEGVPVAEAVAMVAAAARDGLAAGPLDRDAFHQALRERLPDALLPWCRGCKSHHVRPGLWRALGPLGVTVMPAKATYAPAPDTTGSDPMVRSAADRAAGEELARRFLRCFGPATHTQLAAWGQTAPAHAKALFAAIDAELEPVRLDGAPRFVLAEDLPRLEDPPRAGGVRLLGGYDQYVGQPDRETLVPDAALRRRMYPAVARPGAVLVDGRLAGLWRARKRGTRMEIDVEWHGAPADVAGEAAAVARLRGCDDVVVR